MTGSAVGFGAPSCPAPHGTAGRVQLGHGSGGRMSATLLTEHFLPHLANPVLLALGDGAVVPAGPGELVVSTDTFVVSPLEFPGGNIGSLAVHGTLNDVAMMGARPRYLTAGFVLGGVVGGMVGIPVAAALRVVIVHAAAERRAG